MTMLVADLHAPGETARASIYSSPPRAVQAIVVESDDLYRDAVEAELVDEGFAVHAFKDWQTMLAAVADGLRADLLVVDWELESMRSIDLVSRMGTKGLKWPVVFSDAHSFAHRERLALQRGAADFVDKALGIAILAIRLRTIASQRRLRSDIASDDILHCGRLTLRAASCRAYWDDFDVGLTISEFKIVRLLASNVGSFITYRQIYDCMHHAGFIAGSGKDGYRINVRSAVRRIRAKFKMLSPDFNEIQTYSSFGYRWENARTPES